MISKLKRFHNSLQALHQLSIKFGGIYNDIIRRLRLSTGQSHPLSELQEKDSLTDESLDDIKALLLRFRSFIELGLEQCSEGEAGELLLAITQKLLKFDSENHKGSSDSNGEKFLFSNASGVLQAVCSGILADTLFCICLCVKNFPGFMLTVNPSIYHFLVNVLFLMLSFHLSSEFPDDIMKGAAADSSQFMPKYFNSLASTALCCLGQY